MPTSLGIMQILVGPPPPPPWDGPCCPTPQEATTTSRVASRSARRTRLTGLTFSSLLDDSIPPPFTNVFPDHLLLLLPEELVEEHGHQEQDTQHEELPSAGYASQDQAV